MNSRSDVDVENRINEVKSDNTEKWGSRESSPKEIYRKSTSIIVLL